MIKKIILIFTFSVLFSACSEVAFEEGEIENASQRAPQNAGNTNPTDPIKPIAGHKIVEEGFVAKDFGQSGVVDILFVIDNSRSMSEEQARIADKFNKFIDQLSDSDWQIGITTTDLSGGPFSTNGALLAFGRGGDRVLKPTTPNYRELFMDTIRRKESSDDSNSTSRPSGNELPFEAIIEATRLARSTNIGFFRENADLAVIIISDEDEASDFSPGSTQPFEVVSAIRRNLGEDKKHSVFGIIVEPGDRECFNQQAGNEGKYGRGIASLVELTDGLTGSICDSDYSKNLSQIGKKVADLKLSFKLSAPPVKESIRVFLTPAQPKVTYVLNGQTIVFSNNLQAETQIEVKYLTPDISPD